MVVQVDGNPKVCVLAEREQVHLGLSADEVQDTCPYLPLNTLSICGRGVGYPITIPAPIKPVPLQAVCRCIHLEYRDLCCVNFVFILLIC